MKSLAVEKRWRRRTHTLCLLLAAFSASSVQGEEDLFFGELPIVASASRLPQRLQDAPASATIIDKEMIKAMGARDVSDILRIVPGFQTFVRTTHSPRVTYHGIPDEDQSSRIQVLIDGRSQFSPLFDGGVNWSLLPVALENIERIEVIRGTSAASYGGNAFQALVNIVTIDPALTHGTSVAARLGNQGVQDYTLIQGGKFGAAGDYRLTYQQKRDSGLRDRADWQDSYESKMLDWRSDFTLNNQDTLGITLGYIESAMLDGRLGNNANPIHDMTWSSAHLQAAWRRAWGSDSELQLRYAFAEDKSSYRYDGFMAPFGKFTYDPDGSRATRHEFELVHRAPANEMLRYVWGASYRAEQVTSPLYFVDSNPHHRSSARVFGNMEFKANRFLTANLGAGFERDSIVGVMPSGRASLNFHLNPENTIRLGAFSSERAGGITDYSGGVFVQLGNTSVALGRGNPQLGAERVSGVELGYLGAWKSLGLTFDARAFKERIPNRWYEIDRVYPDCVARTTVCLYTSTGARANNALKSNVPVQNVQTHGFEYSASWSPWQETRLVLSQAFVKIKADYLESFLADPANEALFPNSVGSQRYLNFDQMTEQSAPSRSTSLLLIQKLPYGLEFSAFGQWVGQMKWTTNTRVNPYRRFDARLGYPFKWLGKGGEIALTAQSIGEAHGEFDAKGEKTDRLVEHREWISVRLDF
jgi:iron complex outermembrane receptor protein